MSARTACAALLFFLGAARLRGGPDAAPEGHVLEHRENIVDYGNAVIRWYETYLRKE